MRNKKFAKYFKEYQWSNIAAMIRNNRGEPGICTLDFRDRFVVISGATSGIGYITARTYASHGARILCINRSQERSEALKSELEGEFGIKCDYLLADLSKLKDIKRVANELLILENHIDVIIHNAGVYLTRRELTEEGYDKVFVVQYLASFIINSILAEKLKDSGKTRIIMVNSEGHRFAAWGLRLDDLNWEKRRYAGLKSYGSAKLAQLLSMLIFDEVFRGTGVTINAMHPGAVKTETGQENGPVYRWIKRNFLDRSLRPAQISATALYYLGVSDEMDGVSGRFFNLTTEEEPAPPALDKEAAWELWRKSLEMTGVRDIMMMEQ